MKRLAILAALLLATPALADPPTPEMRLAAEIARLNLQLAHAGELIDKQKQQIDDLQAKQAAVPGSPETPPANASH